MMTARRRKITIMAIGGLLTLCVGLIGSLGVLTSEVIKGINNADVADFIFVNGSDKFRCYITDDTNNYISIGWGREAKEAPTNLSVPEIMANNDVDYTVTGIVQGAFRSCDFETISLPDTITEIEEEAFAYCDQLKTFTLPYGVTEIKDSAFIDCRKMTYFLYKNEDGAIVSTNDKITSIGSHAFASCVSLLDFSFSTVLQEIQECAFQRCISFTRIYLPSAEYTGSSTTPNNPYTIGKYAFADCSKLEFVYFEKNLTGVNSYAFANCYIEGNVSMVLHYGYSGKYPGDPAFTTNWRRKNIDPTSTAGNYNIESDHIIVRQHHKYPGLRFSIVTNKVIELDCSKSGTSNKIKLDETKNPYIEIYQWNAPAEADPGTGTIYEDYYNTKTKALEIPGQIKIDETTTYPVKVIKKAAFANKADDIHSLKFNSGLIQICKEAFLKDTEITSIDFTECDTLLEISNDIFNQRNGTRNSHVTSLALPPSLEYIGMYAFWAFDNVQTLKFTTDESKKPHLKVLGGACFGELGRYNGGIGIKVELPGTLDDEAAKRANINYARNSDYNDQNWAAISPYVFGSTILNSQDSKATSQVTVVTMDPNPTPGLSCSLAPNAMNRARRLVKFVANSNLAMVGSEVFKNCNDLREVFLTTAKGKALADAGMQYPWGSKAADGSTYESSILSSGGDGDKPDLVLYLDGPAPGKISTTEMTDIKVKWNSETSKTYNTEFGYANVAKQTADILYQSRSSNPTFINMDFDFTNGSLLYWKPNSTGGGTFENEPKDVNDYNNGLIALAKQKGSDSYVVARYFAANNKVVDEIDLTGLVHATFGNISSKITEIGDEAFAVNSANKKGYYFILPHTVTKISERAFFRKVDNTSKIPITTVGARIVTYKDAEGNVQPAPSGDSYETVKNKCKTATSTDNISGYCTLPNQLTHLGRFAFYSNVFKEVWIPKTLSFFGVGAFYSHLCDSISSRLESIVIEDNGADEDEDPETHSNPNFKEINNGIYYVGSATGKTLLYQAQNIGGTLTIDSGTKAIGMAACAGTKYETINLNSELKTIYGSAFENNVSLIKVTGGENLEYISAIAHDSADEVYQDNDYYQNIDYRDYYAGDYAIRASRTTAFRNCTNLKTFNFKELTSLIKIGHAAFYGCDSLEELTGDDTSYNYYKPKSDGTLPTSPTTTKTNGVLDLAPCTNLRVIGANSFTSKKISYVHLPYSNGELSVARDKADSVILAGNDAEQVIFYGHAPIYLVGDIAYKTYRGNDSITSVDKDKWSNKWYGSDRSKVYFHAFDATDILNGNTEGSVHYWIKHPTDANGYVLLDSKDIATKYFQKNPTYTEVRPA